MYLICSPLLICWVLLCNGVSGQTITIETTYSDHIHLNMADSPHTSVHITPSNPSFVSTTFETIYSKMIQTGYSVSSKFLDLQTLTYPDQTERLSLETTRWFSMVTASTKDLGDKNTKVSSTQANDMLFSSVYVTETFHNTIYGPLISETSSGISETSIGLEIKSSFALSPTPYTTSMINMSSPLISDQNGLLQSITSSPITIVNKSETSSLLERLVITPSISNTIGDILAETMGQFPNTILPSNSIFNSPTTPTRLDQSESDQGGIGAGILAIIIIFAVVFPSLVVVIVCFMCKSYNHRKEGIMNTRASRRSRKQSRQKHSLRTNDTLHDTCHHTYDMQTKTVQNRNFRKSPSPQTLDDYPDTESELGSQTWLTRDKEFLHRDAMLNNDQFSFNSDFLPARKKLPPISSLDSPVINAGISPDLIIRPSSGNWDRHSASESQNWQFNDRGYLNRETYDSDLQQAFNTDFLPPRSRLPPITSDDPPVKKQRKKKRKTLMNKLTSQGRKVSHNGN